jgi:hypothetical protein
MATKQVKQKPVAKKRVRTPKTVDVLVASLKKKNIVWPPVVVLDGGDTVRFQAVNTDATIFLEGALSFEGMTQQSEVFRVPKKRILEITVKPDVVAQEPSGGLTAEGAEAVAGAYPYSVFCSEGCDFAEGNSSPVMLIEPPEDEFGKGGVG